MNINIFIPENLNGWLVKRKTIKSENINSYFIILFKIYSYQTLETNAYYYQNGIWLLDILEIDVWFMFLKAFQNCLHIDQYFSLDYFLLLIFVFTKLCGVHSTVITFYYQINMEKMLAINVGIICSALKEYIYIEQNTFCFQQFICF